MCEKLCFYVFLVDIIGLFFGEDVFIVIGLILFIIGFVDVIYNFKFEVF